MSDEMLARIRKRNTRPKVTRDPSLTAQDDFPAEAVPVEVTPAEVASPVVEESDDSEASDLAAQIDALPKVAARRNIRLEESMDAAMQTFCAQEGVTIDTFLEAALAACDRNANFKQRIVKEAKQRLQQRKEAGKLRRLHSQLQQFRK